MMYVWWQEIQRIEQELVGGNVPARRWKSTWDKQEAISMSGVSVRLDGEEIFSAGNRRARYHSRATHKRMTIELLVKGKLLGEATKGQAHHFERHNYTTPVYCDYCAQLLWGLLKTGQLF